MLSSFIVLGPTGHTVFEKHWREPVTRRALDEFWTLLNENGFVTAAPPAQNMGKLTMVHVQRGPLLLVGALSRDVPVMLAISLLHRVGDLLELYLKELTEDALRANFVTVYQLLDEIIDNGSPLHTEPNVLQQLVMQPGKMESIVAGVTGASQIKAALPESSNSSAPWRRAGVKYSANEFYMDLMERLDAVVDGRNGVLQRAEVWGQAMCNSLLSGMPRLTLSFTSHIIEDVSLHECIARDRWERERVMSFTPPDGKFELCSYRVSRTNQLPVYCTPNISFVPASNPAAAAAPASPESSGGGGGGGGGVGHMQITLGARPTEGRPVEDVTLRMPLPDSCVSSSLTATVGVRAKQTRHFHDRLVPTTLLTLALPRPPFFLTPYMVRASCMTRSPKRSNGILEGSQKISSLS